MKRHSIIPAATIALLFAACHGGLPAVSDQGVDIAYTDSGKGDTTLLFVHGWCLNKSYWSNQVAYFKDRYRVIAIDLPGFGESGKNRSDWTPAAYGADVDSVMSQLHLKNVVIIGHSMSGDIAVQAALHAPDRVIAIVGVDNFKNVGPESPEEKSGDAMAITLMKQEYTKAAEQMCKETLFSPSTPDSIQRRVLTDVLNADSTIAINVLAHLTTDETTPLTQYGKKLYLINSDFGTNDTAALTKIGVPYQFYVIHGPGHFPMIEQPAEFNKDLDTVLSSL